MLDSRQGLGFNLCTMRKYTLKSSPCSYFSTVRLGGLDFTQMYTYIEYYRIIYNILRFYFNRLDMFGILWILLEFAGLLFKENHRKAQKKNNNIKNTSKQTLTGSCIQLGSCANHFDQATIW